MEELLRDFDPITLGEMQEVRLMNRIDTKFVTTVPMLRRLLRYAKADYRVQVTDGERLAPYSTLYFDTPRYEMFFAHEYGHANRQKIRVRTYVDSHLEFLEIKTKDNHGKTAKNRIPLSEPRKPCTSSFVDFMAGFSQQEECLDFVRCHLRYEPEGLTGQLENQFDRITLVNRGKTERLTIDLNLSFHNHQTGLNRQLEGVVVVELKQAGHLVSPIRSRMRQLGILPMGFSKYALGTAMTNAELPHNRLKVPLRRIERIQLQARGAVL